MGDRSPGSRAWLLRLALSYLGIVWGADRGGDEVVWLGGLETLIRRKFYFKSYEFYLFFESFIQDSFTISLFICFFVYQFVSKTVY